MAFLLFWDIIFDDAIPEAFIAPRQWKPIDLYTKYFYPK